MKWIKVAQKWYQEFFPRKIWWVWAYYKEQGNFLTSRKSHVSLTNSSFVSLGRRWSRCWQNSTTYVPLYALSPSWTPTTTTWHWKRRRCWPRVLSCSWGQPQQLRVHMAPLWVPCVPFMELPGVLALGEEEEEFLQACCGVSGRVWALRCWQRITSMPNTWWPRQPLCLTKDRLRHYLDHCTPHSWAVASHNTGSHRTAHPRARSEEQFHRFLPRTVSRTLPKSPLKVLL
jgi:hypothetical protein